MDDMSFDDAIDIVREGIFRSKPDERYDYALDIIAYTWDQDYVDYLNSVVLGRNAKWEDGVLFILVNATQPNYLLVRRDKKAMLI